jgi:hypothetical protein
MRGNLVVIPHPQRAKAHALWVPVMAKTEMMPGVQPLIAEGAKAGKRADIDHGSVLKLFCTESSAHGADCQCGEASGSFLKKSTKKLCFLWGVAGETAIARRNQTFFVELFFKKAAA